MKTNDPKETDRAFLTMIKKKHEHKKIGVNKGTETAGEFEKLCKAKGIQFYSTMNEAKAAFAEHTIRSLKNILYHYMGEYGYQHIQKFSQFVTTFNSRKNRLIYLIPKNVKNSDFQSFLYSKLLREYKKKFKIGDSVRTSRYD